MYNDPTAPCALKCQALGKNLIVELAPKVLDGTRCNVESLDMCISGICQVCSRGKSNCDLSSETCRTLSEHFLVIFHLPVISLDVSASPASWL